MKGKEKEMENEKKKKEEKEKGENGESDTKNVLPSQDASPSTEIGNNITPTKGKLGKNITSTSRREPKPDSGLEFLGGSLVKTTKS